LIAFFAFIGATVIVTITGVAAGRRSALRSAFRNNRVLWEAHSDEEMQRILGARGAPLIAVHKRNSQRYLQWLFIDDDGAYAVETCKLDPRVEFVSPRSGLTLTELRDLTREARVPARPRISYRIWSDYFDEIGK